MLRSLRLRGSERFAFAFVYLMGSISPAASLTRLHFVGRSAKKTGAPQPHFDKRAEWYAAVELDEQIARWTTIECGCAVVAFCLPSMRRLYKRREEKRRQAAPGRRRSGAHCTLAEEPCALNAADLEEGGHGRASPQEEELELEQMKFEMVD